MAQVELYVRLYEECCPILTDLQDTTIADDAVAAEHSHDSFSQPDPSAQAAGR